MEKIITKERFAIAQKYESKYWDSRLYDPAGVIKDLEGTYELANALVQNNYLNHTFHRTLDVGCGGLGLGLLWLINTNLSFGLDPLEVKKSQFNCTLLDVFVNSVQNKTSYLKIGAENMPFEINYFDLIICNNVLDHVNNPYAILKEIKRILTKDGLFAFSVDTHSVRTLMQKRLIKLFNPNYGSLPGHPYEWTEKKMGEILISFGFKVEKHITRSFKGQLFGSVRRTVWLLRNQ